MISAGIYIHVPFCKSKCHYCNFYSIKLSEKSINCFVERIIEEIKQRAVSLPRISSVYFGGGTPSLLSGSQIRKIINAIEEVYDISNNAEITLEANPESVSLDKVFEWKDSGVNRVSLGIQSFSDEELKMLGRVHTSEDIYKAIGSIQEAGIANISGDLICGLPGQSMEEWQNNLVIIKSLNLPHISIYPLQIEEGTMFHKTLVESALEEIEDKMINMMQESRKFLKENGYSHYEIANYAKDGYESKHNMIYWQYKPYIGYGPSAASFINRARFQNVSDFSEWADSFICEEDLESRDMSVQMAEYCFLSLRLLEIGLDKDKFSKEFGVSLDDIHGELLEKLISYGWIIKGKNKYVLSEELIYYANQVFMEFLPS
jgi:oxygen-independent coproporphyrinogen-3 oxidase